MNPFDWKTIVLAKHAQHVALIHFPIALFIAAVGFDLAAHWTKRERFSDMAYYNLSIAAFFTIPTLLTGLIAWRLQLEGQAIKGILLLHIVSACSSALIIWLSWGVHFRARRSASARLPAWRLPLGLLGVFVVMLTGHLGGFLSGVNGGP